MIKKKYIVIAVAIVVTLISLDKMLHQIDPDSIKVAPYMSSEYVSNEEMEIKVTSEARLNGEFSVSSIVGMALSEALPLGGYTELLGGVYDLHEYTIDRNETIVIPAGAGQSGTGELGISMYDWAKSYKYRFSKVENRQVEILVIMGDAFYSIRGEDKDTSIKGEIRTGRLR